MSPTPDGDGPSSIDEGPSHENARVGVSETGTRGARCAAPPFGSRKALVMKKQAVVLHLAFAAIVLGAGASCKHQTSLGSGECPAGTHSYFSDEDSPYPFYPRCADDCPAGERNSGPYHDCESYDAAPRGPPYDAAPPPGAACVDALVTGNVPVVGPSCVVVPGRGRGEACTDPNDCTSACCQGGHVLVAPPSELDASADDANADAEAGAEARDDAAAAPIEAIRAWACCGRCLSAEEICAIQK